MSLDFENNKLCVAIAQHYETKEILMVAYMNAEAYQKTLDWKKENPNHITNNGLSNAWNDIFSKAQEDVILNNFKDWLHEQNYITDEHYKNLCNSK